MVILHFNYVSIRNMWLRNDNEHYIVNLNGSSDICWGDWIE